MIFFEKQKKKKIPWHIRKCATALEISMKSIGFNLNRVGDEFLPKSYLFFSLYIFILQFFTLCFFQSLFLTNYFFLHPFSNVILQLDILRAVIIGYLNIGCYRGKSLKDLDLDHSHLSRCK